MFYLSSYTFRKWIGDFWGNNKLFHSDAARIVVARGEGEFTAEESLNLKSFSVIEKTNRHAKNKRQGVKIKDPSKKNKKRKKEGLSE